MENSHYDIDKSLRNGKICFTTETSCYDLLLVYGLLFAACIGSASLGYDSLNNPTTADKIFGVIMFAICLLMIYGIYRKYSEFKLLLIKTNLDKDLVRTKIEEYISEIGGITLVNKNNFIIAKRNLLFSYKTYTFIITPGQVEYNVQNFHSGRASGTHLPVILEHLFVKSKLTPKFHSTSSKNADRNQKITN
jgi:hypothetical protein